MRVEERSEIRVLTLLYPSALQVWYTLLEARNYRII